MRNDQYIRPGKLFFALALLAIGIIHLLTQSFPAGLMPVDASFPARTLLIYITGISLAIAGVMILVNKYAYIGTMIAAVILVLILAFVHLPHLAANLHDPNAWTSSAEMLALFSGTLIVRGIMHPPDEHKTWGNGWQVTGNYLFALSLVVFGIQHYIYAQFIASLVPAWIPWSLFWVYFVMVAFFATAASIFLHKLVRISTTLLAFMFFFWVCTLHLPRAFADMHKETEWTSLFIAVAMCGISLMVGGTAVHKRVNNEMISS